MSAPAIQTNKIIIGAPSATAATAASNFNTAMATFFANSGGTNYSATFVPQILNSGVAVLPDAAVANSQSYGWALLAYVTPAS